MGRFIISRTADGDRFLLESAVGRRLAVSKTYATPDACKKGIVALVVTLLSAPTVDLDRGEAGENPKCEVFADRGGFCYRIKSQNGKTLLESEPMQTKKAILRALAMLREGVKDPEVVFARRDSFVPVKLELSGVSETAVLEAEAKGKTVKKERAEGIKSRTGAKKCIQSAPPASEITVTKAEGPVMLEEKTFAPSEGISAKAVTEAADALAVRDASSVVIETIEPQTLHTPIDMPLNPQVATDKELPKKATVTPPLSRGIFGKIKKVR